jgi:Putative Flp pilus-assembly TadE/G-like
MVLVRDTNAAKGFFARLRQDSGGNTLAMIAAGLVPLLALVGGGIDMGRSYLSQTRLQQACDAGVLAARKKLGSAVVADGLVPANVATIGDRYFNLNFRVGSYGTENRDFEMTLEEDYSISGVATVDVPTTIMTLFGYTEMPIQVQCEATINFSNTDIMFVLDTTGSMREENDGDDEPRIDVLKDVVRSFHTQIEGSKSPDTRVRYGFVPYSVNVNVGSLLSDDWVVDNWTYQSREDYGTEPSGEVGEHTYTDNWTYISGTYAEATTGSYLATFNPAGSETEAEHRSCDTPPPAGTMNSVYTRLSTVDEPYSGPPAGTMTTKHFRRTSNGTYYWIELIGFNCVIKWATYTNYVDEYDEITIPYTRTVARYRYAPIPRDVSNWRSQTNGCIEERDTYEIDDWDNVDLSRALDLDIDLVPNVGNPATQWRPMYPDIIYERSLDYDGNGSFRVDPVVTIDAWFFQPRVRGSLVACPAPSRKLAEMDATALNGFLDTITPAGNTYHDIGMIWGGRLVSPTGLFAAENVDVDGKATSRHLIFLTDGETAPRDVAYGAYGVEPLDRRRWSETSSSTLTEVVEGRFGVACDEVKKRNVTVWVIAFGTELNPVMTECAGPGRFFQADDSAELTDVFSRIAAQMGDLRVSK